MALGKANPTASTAQLGAAASGGQGSGRQRRWVRGTRAMECTGELGLGEDL
uniref:Uncharacterized protein n=1 Tax=Oryza sativa subsp. japonica TaxID=39947 RepID=Q339D3_ORYSJ|nr:hypothetical protein LOC_Os10g22440 [Oryza sativa Japonica Group]